jgi:hypothetical protein
MAVRADLHFDPTLPFAGVERELQLAAIDFLTLMALSSELRRKVLLILLGSPLNLEPELSLAGSERLPFL